MGVNTRNLITLAVLLAIVLVVVFVFMAQAISNPGTSFTPNAPGTIPSFRP